MNPIVTSRYGKLEGESSEHLSIFRGIPFAAPASGSRRWAAPEKPAGWAGIRDARKFGFVAPQLHTPLGALMPMVIDGPQSEDCLYLNVWTPAADHKRRPVMVWIHGGAFSIGSGSQSLYDGSTLARRGDAVVVTINYRLGPLGFLRLCDLTNGAIPATGNEGILDQIAALEWVRDNIDQFGGDPDNILIFGESAGGMSVGTLLAHPMARGLFHKAIAQSGATHTARSVERANAVAEIILRHLGVKASESDKLRALDADTLLKGPIMPDGITPDPELGMAYQPVADGTHIRGTAFDMVENGSGDGVKVMAGTTLEEWKLFAPMDPSLPKLDRNQLAARIGRRFGTEGGAKMVDTYERARNARGDANSPMEIYCAIETDRIFRIPALRLCETMETRGPAAFNYLFTWKSPLGGGILGSCHALELGFVFGTNTLPGMDKFCGDTAEANALATRMQDAWLAFARNGTPSCDSTGAWPEYSSARRETMVFDGKSELQSAPYENERRAWEGLPSAVLGTL